MREKTNRLAKRAERRKERERIVREEKQAKQMQKIIRDKAKKKRAIEKIKAREEAAYQKRRDETMKQIHEQFERDLRLANGIKQSELALNEIENFVDKTDSRSRKQEKTERKNANEYEDKYQWQTYCQGLMILRYKLKYSSSFCFYQFLRMYIVYIYSPYRK